MSPTRLAGLALALLLAPAALAQAIDGRVVDAETDAPLPGVVVVLDGAAVGAVSDRDGAFRVADVEPGERVLAARIVGYAPQTRTVTVAPGGVAEVTFRLVPAQVDLTEVVVAAARTGVTAAALPAKVTVIGQREVREQQALTSSPAEIVANLVPSFSPARQKLTGFGESFRGRSPLFLVDGVPQSNPLRDGSRDGFTIDPEAVERVEVVFGANAAQGLGATGGIVNYVTTEPPASGRFEQRVTLATTSGDDLDGDGLGWRGHYLASKRFATGAGPVDVLGSVGYERRGLQYDGAGRPIGIDNVQGDLADSHSRNLLGKVVWRPTRSQRVGLMVNDFRLAQDGDFVSEAGDRALGLPTVSVPGAPEGTQPVNDVTTAALDYEHAALGGGALAAKVYVQDFAALYGGGRFGVFQDPALAPVGELFDQSENNSEKVGARLTYSRPGVAGTPVGVVAGVDVLRDETFQRLAQTDRNWVPVTRFLNAAPFVQLDAPVARWLSVSGGVRWEVAALDVPDFTSIAGNRDDFQTVAVAGGSPAFDEPLFNVGAVVTPLDGLRLYGSAAQAFTMPDVGRVLRGVSEAGTAVEDVLALDPIVTDNAEVGVTYASTWASFGATVFVSESDFGSRLVPNADGLFQVRREPTRTSGWEVTGRLDPAPWVSLGAGASGLDGRFDGDDDGDFEADLGAADVGPDRLNLSLDLGRGGPVRGRLQSFTFFDRTFRDGAGEVAAEFDGYTVLDASVTAGLGRAAVTLAAANLLDADYITYFGQAATDRADRFFAGRGRTLTLRVTARL